MSPNASPDAALPPSADVVIIGGGVMGVSRVRIDPRSFPVKLRFLGEKVRGGGDTVGVNVKRMRC